MKTARSVRSARCFPRAAACLAALAAASSPAAAAGDRPPLEVVAQVRDFTLTHPDFQRPVDADDFNFTLGLVRDRLDADGNPVLSEAASRSTDPDREVESAASFAQWYSDGHGQSRRHRVPLRLDFDPDSGLYTFQRDLDTGDGFFPVDGFGPGPGGSDGLHGTKHNYYFTTEIETVFRYSEPESREHPLTLTFVGDDDVWVFLDGRLVLDMGGTHSPREGTVDVDAVAERLGLEPGRRYVLKVFHAERRQWMSNFRLQTTMELMPTQVEPLFD